MAQNLFSDFPERIDAIQKHSRVSELALPLEETLGEPGFFKSEEEAMDIYLGTLSEIGKFAAVELAPHAAAIDAEGISKDGDEIKIPDKLTSHLKQAGALGIFASTIDKANGGFNMPRAVTCLAVELLGHACPNTALTIANFSMGPFFVKYATEEQKKTYLERFLSGDITTSMALTEADAGSDLGSLRTVAVKEGDHYVINGTKLFISSGNAEVSFVLARTVPKSEGLNGLSVLLAPRRLEGKEEDNFKVTKTESKICLHASPTCEMVFENSIGYAFGPEGEGFKVMADLMNEARIAMGGIALGICASAMHEAKQYARSRVAMGKPIIQHPMVADMIYEGEIEIRAMRAMIIEAGCAHDWMMIYEKKEDRKNFKRWQKRYRRLTPLIKYMCAEKAVTLTRNALQIFGGYGVCTDYPAERLYRESIIYPIYEGTSQIQSLMVLKDTLKDVAMQATGFLGSLAGAWSQSKITIDPIKSHLLQARNELNQAIKLVLMSIIKGKFKADIDALKEKKIQNFLKEFSLQLLTPQMDLTVPFLVAERLTRIVCDYYALKCMVDNLKPGDKEQEKWTLEFAKLAVPRMRLENQYMVNRLPSTLDFIKEDIEKTS